MSRGGERSWQAERRVGAAWNAHAGDGDSRNIEAGANDLMDWSDGLDREQVNAVIEFAARSLDSAPVLTP